MFLKIIAVFVVLFECVLSLTAIDLSFPLADQPEEIQNAARRGLSSHITKDFPLPKDMSLIPYVDCLARSTGLPRPRPRQVLRQLESFSRRRFIEEMLRCIGNRRAGMTAIQILRRNDERLLNFFLEVRYVVTQWLRQLERQEKNRPPRSGLLSPSTTLFVSDGSPLDATDKLEQVIDPSTVITIASEPPCLGCLYDDIDDLDGIGGVVIGAFEEVGRGFIRLTGGLRRFQTDLKKFVNSGTNLLIG